MAQASEGNEYEIPIGVFTSMSSTATEQVPKSLPGPPPPYQLYASDPGNLPGVPASAPHPPGASLSSYPFFPPIGPTVSYGCVAPLGTLPLTVVTVLPTAATTLPSDGAVETAGARVVEVAAKEDDSVSEDVANSNDTDSFASGDDGPPELRKLQHRLVFVLQCDGYDREHVVCFKRRRYSILGTNERFIFKVKEKRSFCCGANFFCCVGRRMLVKLKDKRDNNQMIFHRPIRCICSFFPCCRQKLHISCPPGKQMGTVEQQCSLIRPHFLVRDHKGDIIYKIRGPNLLGLGFRCGEKKFIVNHPGSAENVGLIKKSGVDEARLDIGGGEVSNVRHKACLLGALYLISSIYYQLTDKFSTDDSDSQ